MKKPVIIMLIVSLITLGTTVWGNDSKVALGVEAGMFFPGNSIFQDVYGTNGFAFGVNGAFKFSKNFALQGAFDMFSADGETTISMESVTLNQNTLRLGVYACLPVGKIIPRAGAGASMNWLKEEGPFEPFSDSAPGWFVALGIDLDVLDKVMFGFEVLYNDAKLDGDFGSESIGGVFLLFSLKLKL